MAISRSEVEYIRDIFLSKNSGLLSEEKIVETHDSLDSLALDDLAEVFAIAKVGEHKSIAVYEPAFQEAIRSGYILVNAMFEQDFLGSHLETGLRLLTESGFSF